jgi:hypothetical protein
MITILYRCPIIGDGSEGDERRPYVDTFRVKWSIYGQFPEEGTHCLVNVTASEGEHAAIEADDQVEVWNDAATS